MRKVSAGAHLLGTLEDMLIKAPDTTISLHRGLSIGVLLRARVTWNQKCGSYTGDFE